MKKHTVYILSLLLLIVLALASCRKPKNEPTTEAAQTTFPSEEQSTTKADIVTDADPSSESGTDHSSETSDIPEESQTEAPETRSGETIAPPDEAVETSTNEDDYVIDLSDGEGGGGL